MTRYYKIIEGSTIWFKEPLIIGDFQYFNPTEEMILNEGWIKYEKPAPTIEELKREKLREVDAFDMSSEVNEFFIGEDSLWMDKVTRSGIILTLEACKKIGQDVYTFWYEFKHWDIPVELAYQMLLSVESYASSCFLTTSQHKANINNLESAQDIQNYDYRVGYPEKIHFELS